MSSDPPRPHATSAKPRGRRHPVVILSVILACQLMVVLDGTIVTIALPQIRESLRFSTADLSWVLNAYTLTFGGLLLLGARAGDILGRRATFVWGIALFTAASLLGGLAQSPTELLIARAAQGVGGAIASPSALALLMTMFAEGRERNRALGLYTAVSVSGGAVGLIAGGMLVEWVSWRWVMFVNVPIGAAVAVLAGLVVPETARIRGRFDLTGALTSTVGMAALVYGFVKAATDGWSDPETIVAFVLGVVLLVAFVITERRAQAPITPLRLFKDRNRATAYLARLMMVAGMMGMFFFLTQFLQNILGYTPIQTGLAFLPITVVLFVSSQVTARYLIERFDAKALMIIGIALSGGGLVWLTQLSAGSSYAWLVGSLLMFGTGNGLGFMPLTAVALAGVRAEDSGAASGLVNVMQQVGGSLGLAVLVTVFGATFRHVVSHPGGLTGTALNHHAFAVAADRAFAVSSGFVIATLLLVIFAIRSVPRPGHPTPEEALLEELNTAGSISATASG